MKYKVVLYDGVNQKKTRTVEVEANREKEAFEKAKQQAKENGWKEKFGLTIQK